MTLLSEKPLELQEGELRAITTFITTVKANRYYEALLSALIPALDFKTDKAEFIGRGAGIGSFNSHRKVKIDEEFYFEKVYFNSHIDKKKTLWLHENLYPFIRDRIKVPQTFKIYEGEIVTAFYDEFLDLKAIELPHRENAWIRISIDLYESSIENEVSINKLTIPAWFTDYRTHYLFKKNYKEAVKRLVKSELDIQQLEVSVNRSRLVITHGDFFSTNVYQSNILIDWDNCGYYPIGFEQAFLFNMLGKNYSKEKTWLEDNYNSFVSEKDWDDFRRNFFYFLFIFSLDDEYLKFIDESHN